MKKVRISISLAIAATMFFAASVSAQEMPMMGDMPFDMSMLSGMGAQTTNKATVEEEAIQKADEMNAELNLSEKQYKQVVKVLKTEIQQERNLMSYSGGSSMGSFMGGDMMMGGGMPAMGDMMMGGGDMMMGGGSIGSGGAATEKEFARVYNQGDKKLQKILTEEQYNQWRSNHAIPTAPAKPESMFAMN